MYSGNYLYYYELMGIYFIVCFIIQYYIYFIIQLVPTLFVERSFSLAPMPKKNCITSLLVGTIRCSQFILYFLNSHCVIKQFSKAQWFYFNARQVCLLLLEYCCVLPNTLTFAFFFSMLKQPCIPGTSPTCSGSIILFSFLIARLNLLIFCLKFCAYSHKKYFSIAYHFYNFFVFTIKINQVMYASILISERIYDLQLIIQ